MAFYTVTEFAKKAGISARMLRHYDEKGLLKPSGYSEGGYRLYTDEDMAVLQRIVSLRYLNFSLPQIKSVLQMEKGQDIRASLRRQKEEFEREQEHLRQIIQALDTLEKEEEFEWQKLSEVMQIVNSEEQVQKRFEDSWRRDRCADLHHRYSTNPDQWLRFLYRQMKVKAGDRVIEIDASDGIFWTENADQIPRCRITQTAPSEVVLDRIRGNMEAAEWKEACNFDYALVPTGRISLPKQTYDVIVANHLFIHSNDLAHVLETCCDALKPGGHFYCTAIGQGHMKELLDLAIEYDSGVHFYNMDCLQNFSMENGTELLGRYFEDVSWHPYIDSIETDDANALLDYLWGTYSNIQTVLAHKRDGLLRHIQKRIREKGKLIIHKEQGISSARRPQ